MKVSGARGIGAIFCLLLLVGCETTSSTPETMPASPLASLNLPNIFKSSEPAVETTASVAAPAGVPVVVSAPDFPSAVDDTYSPAANPDAKALLGGIATTISAWPSVSSVTGNYGLAERYYRRAAESHHAMPNPGSGLAAAYDRLKRFDLADRAYAQLLRLRGPTAEVLNNIGYSYMLRGDYTRANQKLREALAKDPDNPYVITNLTLLEESQDSAQGDPLEEAPCQKRALPRFLMLERNCFVLFRSGWRDRSLRFSGQ